MRLVLEHQIAHALGLAVLVAVVAAGLRVDGVSDGSLLGIQTSTWVWLGVANAVVHQVFVWLCWRLELHGQSLTRRFGKAAFPAYQVVFAILILARPVLAVIVALSNSGSLGLPPTLAYALATICVVPGVYLVYSIKRYFGFKRAFGIDHFDPAYRSAPLIRKGIFRFSSNSMYVYGFLILWAPAFAFNSSAALLLAAFSHVYIWVHYACTERPDMRRIYG
ncbi:MAG: PEMT/PEM2 methyltransferase family protein [Planctomycetota bacterium]